MNRKGLTNLSKIKIKTQVEIINIKKNRFAWKNSKIRTNSDN